jgi:hypothetical protein
MQQHREERKDHKIEALKDPYLMLGQEGGEVYAYALP